MLDDRGSVGVQVVIATPALLLVLLMIVQFALWAHATHVAQAAAAQGLAASRVVGGTAAAGSASAQQLLGQLDSGPLTHTSVSSVRDARSATITITGEANAVLPFLHLPVRAQSTGPVEVFRPDLAGP